MSNCFEIVIYWFHERSIPMVAEKKCYPKPITRQVFILCAERSLHSKNILMMVFLGLWIVQIEDIVRAAKRACYRAKPIEAAA